MSRRAVILFLVLGIMALPSCVERRMTILSEPPGARAYVDGKYVGDTPITLPFQHYGTREIQVRRARTEKRTKGHTPQTHRVDIRPPLYERFPFDFVSEVLYPGRITDHRVYVFRMEETDDLNRAALMERAEYFRSTAPSLRTAPTETSTSATSDGEAQHSP